MARLILTQEQRAMREQLKLNKWAKNETTRRYFFEMIDLTLEKLCELTKPDEPGDGPILMMLAGAVSADPSVEDHILRRNVENPDWEQISRCCGAMMYEAYLRACADG